MSEHTSYARSVKAVESKQIFTLLSTIHVSASELIDNVSRLKAEGILLGKESMSWAVTKSVAVGISKSIPGFNAGTPILDTIQSCADVIVSMNEPLQRMIKGFNQSIWSGESMTVRQVYILSTIEQMEFWTRYSNKLLDALLSMSNAHDFKLDKYLTKNELLYINGSQQLFTNISISLLKGKTALVKEIEGIPNIDADDETSSQILAGMGGTKPELARGFGIHLVNPYYWYKELVKEIDLVRIRNMQDENDHLAMKINQAVNKKNGTNDASLDHRIEKYREDIIKNSMKMNTIIDSYKES